MSHILNPQRPLTAGELSNFLQARPFERRVLRAVKGGHGCLREIKEATKADGMIALTSRQVSSALQRLKKKCLVSHCCLRELKEATKADGMIALTSRQVSSALQRLKKKGLVKSWPWKYTGPPDVDHHLR